jgi:hypothetical protein
VTSGEGSHVAYSLLFCSTTVISSLFNCFYFVCNLPCPSMIVFYNLLPGRRHVFRLRQHYCNYLCAKWMSTLLFITSQQRAYFVFAALPRSTLSSALSFFLSNRRRWYPMFEAHLIGSTAQTRLSRSLIIQEIQIKLSS